MKSLLRGSGVALLATALLLPFAGLAQSGDPVPTIELITTTEGYDPIRYESAFMIADAWRELGFSVDVRPMEFSTILNLFYDRQEFDATILGWSGRVERLDPQHFLGTLHGEQTDLGGNNPGGYIDPVVDTLFEDQAREFDVDLRRIHVHQIQDVAAEDVPVNVLFYRDEVNAYNHRTFEGFVPMAGEAIYTEWLPFDVRPLTDKRVITIGTPQEPDTINPLDSTSVWGWKFMRLVYDKLVRLSPDIEPVPWAAEEITPVDDVTIDVLIREGMLFHDGMPVTPEDVKFTYDYFIAKDFAYFRPFYRVIDTVELVGERTVRFNLKEPNAPFITVTLSQIPILPQHIWEGIEEPADLAPGEIPTVGSGPMVFDRYERGEYKRVLTFEDHFRADEIDIDGIDWIIYADQEGVLTGLITEECDMTAWRLEPGGIPVAEAQEHLTVVSVPDFGYYHLTMNLRRSPFDDVEARRALSLAIDKNTIIDVLLDGRGEPGTSVIAPVNAFWHNPDVAKYPWTATYDMDMARSMLEDAGYSWDAQGRILLPAND